MFGRFRVILLLPLAILLAGCSEYVDDYQYQPRPALAQIPPAPPQQAPPVTVLASIMGVHREDSKLAIPESVEVRMQIQNTGAQSVAFDSNTFALTNGELLNFAPPSVRPPQPLTLGPGQLAMLVAYFPFPPGRSYGNMDMETLQLRWLVQFDGHSVGQVIYFRREHDYYYNPYWNAPPYYGGWGWYGGVVIVGHRR